LYQFKVLACHLSIILLFLLFKIDAFGQSSDSLTVKDIYITGNKLTRSFVLLREITIHKGDRVAKIELNEKIAQSEKFLINTSLFHNVNISDSLHEDNLYLYIKVNERFPAIPELQLKYADPNFDAWLKDPRRFFRLTYGLALPIKDFRGRNETLTLSAIFGWRQTFGIDYKVPYLNKEKTLGIETIFSYQQGHEVGAITDSNQLKYVRVDANNIFHKISYESDLIYRKKHQVTHTFTLGFDYYDINDTVVKVNPDYLGGGRTSIRVPRFGYKFVYDKRDYAFYALKGDYIATSIEHDGLPVLLKDINVTTIDLTYRKFIPIGGRFYYEGGFTSEYDLQGNLPYIFRSSLGYRYQVPGFEYFVDDGRAYILAQNELKFLAFTNTFKILQSSQSPVINKFSTIPISIYLKLFASEGAVFYDNTSPNNTLLNKLLNGVGAGFDFITYYDKIVRVEYSFNNLGKSYLFLHFTEVF